LSAWSSWVWPKSWSTSYLARPLALAAHLLLSQLDKPIAKTPPLSGGVLFQAKVRTWSGWSLQDLDFLDGVLLDFTEADGQYAVFEYGFDFFFFHGYGQRDST